MSFSQEVKNEILRHRITKPCCNAAAAYAVACFGKYFDDRGVVLQTENEGVANFAQKVYRRCGIQGAILRKDRPAGPVFVTRSGKPMSRTSVTTAIQHLAKSAGVEPEKCNPRCLRKLYLATRTDIERSVRLLAEQAYERVLDAEQLAAGWGEGVNCR